MEEKTIETTLDAVVDQAVADYDEIEESIESSGVDVPVGTPTADYAELIGDIPTVVAPRKVVQGIATETINKNNLVSISPNVTIKYKQLPYDYTNLIKRERLAYGQRTSLYSGAAFWDLNGNYGANMVYKPDFNGVYVIQRYNYYWQFSLKAPTTTQDRLEVPLDCLKYNENGILELVRPYTTHFNPYKVSTSNIIITNDNHYLFAFTYANNVLSLDVLQNDGTGHIRVTSSFDFTNYVSLGIDKVYKSDALGILADYDETTGIIKIITRVLYDFTNTPESVIVEGYNYANEYQLLEYNTSTGVLSYIKQIDLVPVFNIENSAYSHYRLIHDVADYNNCLLLTAVANSIPTGDLSYKVNYSENIYTRSTDFIQQRSDTADWVYNTFEPNHTADYYYQQPDVDANYIFKNNILYYLSGLDFRYTDSTDDTLKINYTLLVYNYNTSEYSELRQTAYVPAPGLKKYSAAQSIGVVSPNVTRLVHENMFIYTYVYLRSTTGSSAVTSDATLIVVSFDPITQVIDYQNMVFASDVASDSVLGVSYIPLKKDNKIVYELIGPNNPDMAKIGYYKPFERNTGFDTSLVHDISQAQHIGTANESALVGDPVEVRVWTEMDGD